MVTHYTEDKEVRFPFESRTIKFRENRLVGLSCVLGDNTVFIRTYMYVHPVGSFVHV